MIQFRSTNPQVRIAMALERSGDLSRQQLVEITGIPRPRLSTILQEMLHTGALSVSERVKADGRGRPTELLMLNANSPQHVGISLQHQISCITVTNTLFHPIFEATIPNSGADIAQRCEEIWEQAVIQAEAAGVNLNQPVSVGCSIPGLLPDPIIGSRRSTALENARNASTTIRELTGINPVICGTAPAAAVAEARSHPDLENCLYVRISDGIGAALILNNALMIGAHSIAGEIGHIEAPGGWGTDEGHHLDCQCGKRGCLETVVSNSALCKWFAVASIHNVAAAWFEDKPGAREHLLRAARSLGEAIAAATMLIDPGTVILSWALAHQIPELFNAVREGMRNELLPGLRDVVRLNLATLPEPTAAALGAAIWPSAVSNELD